MECIYCGNNFEKSEMTKDHIPPKSLFTKPRPNNLITVYVCKNCNSKRSKDDEYMKIKLNFRKNIATNPDYSKNLESIFNGLKRKESKKLLNQLNSETNYFDNTFYIDNLRLEKVNEDIVRGLYFYHTKKTIPESYIIKSYTEEALRQHEKKEMIELLKKFYNDLNDSSEKDIGNGVFKYKYKINVLEIEHCSIWHFQYYNDMNFLTIVLPKKY